MLFRFPAIQQKHHKSVSTLFQNSLLQIVGETTGNKNQQQVNLNMETLILPIPVSPVKNEKKQHAIGSMLIHYEIEGTTEEEQAKNLVKQILETNGALLKSHVHEIFRHQASQGIVLIGYK